MKGHYPQTCYECAYCASWGHNSQKCDVCRRERIQEGKLYEMVYQKVARLTRCQRERLKHGSSYELGIFMLTALSSTLPDLKMQFTQRSVSVLGDHMLAALLSCDSTPDSVLEAEVNQDELATRHPTSAPSLKAEVQ